METQVDGQTFLGTSTIQCRLRGGYSLVRQRSWGSMDDVDS